MVSFTPRPLYPRRKSPLYQFDRRIGILRSRSGHGGDEKNFPSLPEPGIDPGEARSSPVIILTELPQFLTENIKKRKLPMEMIACFQNRSLKVLCPKSSATSGVMKEPVILLYMEV
jgi:hypothetical protein